MKRLTILLLIIVSLASLCSCMEEAGPGDSYGRVIVSVSGRQVPFDTLEEAFASVSEGGSAVVTVNEDVVIRSQITVADRSITLQPGNRDVCITRDFS
ncbi:MAG: hypothetical protein IKX15_05865, partial [Spirochaetales bacterium]|nr:hypothetical protein [Spirochaetales bacterium]